jgi:hypothetical protein
LFVSATQSKGEQFLRALTAGDERQVYVPVQRAAAILKSKIEYDAGNIDQSAIWMRRAVIGILFNKEAVPIEILDVLTEYAAHLARMRRPLDAYALYVRLEPIYTGAVPKHSPRYIRFTAQYLQTLTAIGSYAVADRTLADLKEAVKGVDYLAPSITEVLLLQDLYQLARSVPENDPSVVEYLKKLTADYPDLLTSPTFRIGFAYFRLLGGNFQLADEYTQTFQTGQSENPQIRAYDLLLQSMAAGGQKDFPRSLRLAREGVEQLRLVLHRFESLSSDWSPMLRIEERLVLGGILAINADRVTSAEDKDTLFDITQLLNSDRSKLGLTTRISREALKLDLQREDVRTRDRLKDLRDRLMDDAVRTLITRIAAPPEKDQSSSQKVDAAPKLRLEEIEDKIVIADQQIQGFSNSSQDLLTRIKAAQDILRPDEALVLHNSTPFGIAQICIVPDRVQFHFEPFFPIGKSKQVTADAKLIFSAVHAEYAPSPTLDESFPSDSAYRLYTLLFGGISDCIKNKTHLLLATDPDLSACNTAATDGAASGRGLSGLANAFFFAGARSVAVTQWAVFSEVAQTLGAGLITRSIGPDGVGVAEALRRTMVDFISEAKDDYRAHPRFWAAFTIAGDGAIKPLDGRAANDIGKKALRVENNQLTADASQQEFQGVAKLPANGSIYAVGRLKPAPGSQFAGSYLARLDPIGRPNVIAVDPAIAAGSISTVKEGMIRLDYTYSQERKSAALFRLMDNEGQEVWRFSEDGPLWDAPVDAVAIPKGYILVSIAGDLPDSPTTSPSKLVINLLSATGEQLSRREYIVADRPLSANAPAFAIKGNGNELIVAINKPRTAAEEKLPVWVINPITGSPRVCVGGNMTTFLDINSDSLISLSG